MELMIASVNPATGETLRTFEPLSDAEVDAALARADAAWRTYRHTALADRARWLVARRRFWSRRRIASGAS
jgi:succinate-semialdehyde dehydrogenase/glutarate-semialdehyde dehydrogenase